MPCPSSPDGFVDDALRDFGEFDVFGLAHLAKPGECFIRGTSSAAAQQADGLVDDRSSSQRLLQLGRECMGLGQELGVVDGNCSRGRE